MSIPCGGHARRHAFTLIELLVVIAIVVILAALAVPVAMMALGSSTRVQCASHLRQFASALFLYRNAYDGFMHYSGTTGLAPPEALLDLVKEKDLFLCPADDTPENFNWWTLKHDRITDASYMWNEHVLTAAIRWRDVVNAQEVGLVSDGGYVNNGRTWRNARPGVRVDWNHGNDAVNVLFADQRVERIIPTELAAIRSAPR